MPTQIPPTKNTLLDELEVSTQPPATEVTQEVPKESLPEPTAEIKVEQPQAEEPQDVFNPAPYTMRHNVVNTHPIKTDEEMQEMVDDIIRKGGVVSIMPSVASGQLEPLLKVAHDELERSREAERLRLEEEYRAKSPTGTLEGYRPPETYTPSTETARKIEEFTDTLVQSTDSIQSSQHEDIFINSEERRQRSFVQGMPTPSGQFLEPSLPSETPPVGVEGRKLTGAAARVRVLSMLNLGGAVVVPLWHSGFWVTIRTPVDIELINFYENIAGEVTELGRNTQGLSLSNSQVLIVSDLMDLFIECVERCSLAEDLWRNKRDILQYISQNDVLTIAWALGVAIYPNGFDFTRAAAVRRDDGTLETTRLFEKLNLRRTLWVDETVFSEKQIAMMQNRTLPRTTLANLQDYQLEFKNGYSMRRRVKINEYLYMDLEVPNIPESINAGERWIALLNTALTRSMNLTEDEIDDDAIKEEKRRKRIARLNMYTEAAPLTQYSGWVKRLVLPTVDKEGNAVEEYIEDKNDILQNLLNIPRGQMATDALEEIIKFTQDSVISTMAVPSVSDYEDAQASPRFPHLVAIDPLTLFFILCHWKVKR